MNVVSKPQLRKFWESHPDAESPLLAWHRTARKAQWHTLAEVKQTYPHADLVGECTVFNIKGNDYRLVTKIKYRRQAIYIKKVMTHAEYDRRRWRDECKC
jgi:mRNA interferase HigB